MECQKFMPTSNMVEIVRRKVGVEINAFEDSHTPTDN